MELKDFADLIAPLLIVLGGFIWHQFPTWQRAIAAKRKERAKPFRNNRPIRTSVRDRMAFERKMYFNAPRRGLMPAKLIDIPVATKTNSIDEGNEQEKNQIVELLDAQIEIPEIAEELPEAKPIRFAPKMPQEKPLKTPKQQIGNRLNEAKVLRKMDELREQREADRQKNLLRI